LNRLVSLFRFDFGCHVCPFYMVIPFSTGRSSVSTLGPDSGPEACGS
jgi:hypothetical protein